MAIGSDQVVYHALGPAGGGSRHRTSRSVDGVDPGPMKAYRVAIDTDANTGQAQVVAIGLDHRIWHRIRYSNGTWTSWGLTDPTFQATDVAIGIDAAGNAHLVAVGLDNTVWHRVRYANGGWSPWAYPAGYNGAQMLKATKVAVAVDRTGSLAGQLEPGHHRHRQPALPGHPPAERQLGPGRAAGHRSVGPNRSTWPSRSARHWPAPPSRSGCSRSPPTTATSTRASGPATPGAPWPSPRSAAADPPWPPPAQRTDPAWPSSPTSSRPAQPRIRHPNGDRRTDAGSWRARSEVSGRGRSG